MLADMTWAAAGRPAAVRATTANKARTMLPGLLLLPPALWIRFHPMKRFLPGGPRTDRSLPLPGGDKVGNARYTAGRKMRDGDCAPNPRKGILQLASHPYFRGRGDSHGSSAEAGRIPASAC